MKQKLKIRDSVAGDVDAIEVLYPEAFPDEDLLPLVRELLHDSNVTANVTASLVGVMDAEIVGHVIFTKCGIAGTRTRAALLGPLVVSPKWHRQGFGRALVQAGLSQQHATATRLVCVLGDPGYYGRLGFAEESLVEPPFPLPEQWQAAWQSQYLDDAAEILTGKLTVPSPWNRPALWTP